MNRLLNSTERKTCYQILAAIFSYPEQGLVDSLQLCLKDLSHLLDLPIPAELQQPSELTDLEVAYTGLFINRLGGAPAPPYGSIYLGSEAQLMGASNLRVAESYSSEGLNMDASDEPADFLATELEFLYYLVNEEEAAEEDEDATAVANWQQKQSNFCRELLHPWLPVFCQRIKESNGGHPLYSWTAAALKQFSELEKSCFPPQP